MSPRFLGPGTVFPFDADFKDLTGTHFPDSAVATIRRGAKYGRGAAIEPAVTNLNTAAHFATIRAYNTTDFANAVGGVVQPGGWRRMPRQGPTKENQEIFLNSSYAVTAGTRYTQSVLFRSDATSMPTFGMSFFTNNGHHTVAAQFLELGNGVYWAAATYVIEAGGTTLRAIDLNSINWKDATYIEFLEPMVFAHTGVQAAVTSPIFTSHVWGTRAGGLLRYPGSMLPRTAGTISCWIRPNFNYVTQNSDWHGIVTTTTTHQVDQFQLWITKTGQLGAYAYATGLSGTQFNLTYTPPAWDPNRLYHIACTWSDTEQVLYLDGVPVARRTGNFTRWTQAAYVLVGAGSHPSASTNVLDGLLDDLAVLDTQLSDADIAAIYAMGQPYTGHTALTSAGAIAEFVHLLDFEFSGGHVYLNTGAQELSWGGQTWQAVGGLLELGGVEETSDSKGQGIDVKLSGVNQSIIAALLNNRYRGRPVRIYRAYLDQRTGQVAGIPILLLQGLQLNPYQIEETRAREGGTVTVSTRLAGYFGINRVRGIQTNLVSHQHHFAGDTFFQHVANLQNVKIYWGTAEPRKAKPREAQARSAG